MRVVLGGLRIRGFPPTPGFFIKIWAGVVCIATQQIFVIVILTLSSVFFLNLYMQIILYVFQGSFKKPLIVRNVTRTI